jgi:hypothetical protein
MARGAKVAATYSQAARAGIQSDPLYFNIGESAKPPDGSTPKYKPQAQRGWVDYSPSPITLAQARLEATKARLQALVEITLPPPADGEEPSAEQLGVEKLKLAIEQDCRVQEQLILTVKAAAKAAKPLDVQLVDSQNFLRIEKDKFEKSKNQMLHYQAMVDKFQNMLDLAMEKNAHQSGRIAHETANRKRVSYELGNAESDDPDDECHSHIEVDSDEEDNQECQPDSLYSQRPKPPSNKGKTGLNREGPY